MPTPLKLADHTHQKPPRRFNFTIAALAQVTPPTKGRLYVYDSKQDGLALAITGRDHRSFYLCRKINGRACKMKLGNLADLSVEQARRRVMELGPDIARGQDPAEHKRQSRGAATFGELFDLYLETHAKKFKRSWREDERQYNSHLKQWANRRLDQISRQDVQAWHTRIGKTAPVAANRALALLRKMFNTSIASGFVGSNPAQGVQRYTERSRERFMDLSEVGRFLLAVDEEPESIFQDYFQLLLFTGQRRNNVAAMRWEHIDVARAIWTIPGSEFKTGRTLEIPLVACVMATLQARKTAQDTARNARQMKRDLRDDPRQVYVFPSKRREAKTPHLAEPKTGFKRICQAAGITGLRLHDLRRTVASIATMDGVPYPVVARMLGHTAQGVTAIYARTDLTAVRAAFERTAGIMLAQKLPKGAK